MFFTTIILAIREIRRHLLRSFLTTLGIVIGVAAVVTMVTLGKGATAAVAEQISSLGANILQIRPGQGFGRGGGGPQAPDFTMDDVEAIEGQIAGVRAVAPQAQSSGLAVRNAANWQTNIAGTTGQFFTAQQWALTDGRIWTDAEEQAGKAVCVIGNTVRQNLFPREEPVGQRFRVRDIACEVIGTLASRGQGGFQDQDDVVIMPIKAVQRRFTGNRDIRFIMVAVDDAYDTASVQSQIENLLRERRHISRGEQDNFNIFDTRQISETLQGTTRILTAVMGAVAAVSLIVGGIGIMNIMLVSVTERTARSAFACHRRGSERGADAPGRGGGARPLGESSAQLLALVTVILAAINRSVSVRSAHQSDRVQRLGADRHRLCRHGAPPAEPDRRYATNERAAPAPQSASVGSGHKLHLPSRSTTRRRLRGAVGPARRSSRPPSSAR
jgi:putative ABC transport system permease protein